MDTFIDKAGKKMFSIGDTNVINVFTDKFKKLIGKEDETNQSEDVPRDSGRNGEPESGASAPEPHAIND